MEEEIMFYFKLGLEARAKNFEYGKAPHLELVLNFCNHFEVGDKFGQHICGYYKKVMLSKKRMYEEIGILLMQIPNLSVCLQMKERKSAFPSANEDDLSPRKIAIDLP
jgi:hypothetical protein